MPCLFLRKLGFAAGQALGWKRGVDDGAVAGQARRLDEFVVPLHGELLRRLVDERLDEGVEVARVEARRRVGEAARHVEVADDLDAVVLRHLAGLGDFAVAAALDREVDDDRARLHGLHHGAGDQLRGRAARNERRGDDDVLLGDVAETSSACLAWYSLDISLA